MRHVVALFCASVAVTALASAALAGGASASAPSDPAPKGAAFADRLVSDIAGVKPGDTVLIQGAFEDQADRKSVV